MSFISEKALAVLITFGGILLAAVILLRDLIFKKK